MDTAKVHRAAEGTGVSREWPVYTRQEVVHANRIKAVQVHDAGSVTLHFVDSNYGPIDMHADDVATHCPKAGDWIVLARDKRTVMEHREFMLTCIPHRS